jgi:hypothetical protein
MVFNATFNNIPVLIFNLERTKIFWKQRWNTPNKVTCNLYHPTDISSVLGISVGVLINVYYIENNDYFSHCYLRL